MTCRHPRDQRTPRPEGGYDCWACQRTVSAQAVKRGRNSRSYGTRAELAAARLYGGTKVGHMGGAADIVGVDFQTQMKTRRSAPPAEWIKAFAAMDSGDQLPRLLLRFVAVGKPPVDFMVVPGAAWLLWYGRDEVAE